MAFVQCTTAAYAGRANSASLLANMSVGLVLAKRYRLVEELGRGGMGSVWRAVDLELDAPAAVKLIEPELLQSSEAVARFKREAKAAAAIRSTHVVQTFGYGVDNGIPYIAMELLKGESLAQRLERVRKLSPADTAYILGQVARALGLAHKNGIVHRDMKPDNVFLVREDDAEVCKVLDFGIARHRGGLDDSGGVKTKTGAVLGTPYYMSPEQATAKTVDHLTDIWSYGVIATECITGKRPFESDSIGGLFSAICMEPIVAPSQLGPVPAGFDAWFAKAAARDKSARFQTIKEAVDKLELVCGRSSGRPSAVSIPVERGDTALSQGTAPAVAAGPAGSRIAVGMQTTSAPSSRSIPGLSKPSRTTATFLATIVTVLVMAGLYVGWRSMIRSGATLTKASVSASVPSSPSQSPVSVSAASVTAEPRPMTTAVPIALGANRDAGIITTAANLLPQRAAITKSEIRPKTTQVTQPGAGSPVTPSAKGSGSAPSGASVSTAPKPNCDPPYTLDDQGRKYFKPECYMKR